jgi:hypothetical protein
MSMADLQQLFQNLGQNIAREIIGASLNVIVCLRVCTAEAPIDRHRGGQMLRPGLAHQMRCQTVILLIVVPKTANANVT